MNIEINVQIEKVCQQFMPLVKKYAWKYKNSVQDAESEAWLIVVSAVHTYDPDIGVPLAGYIESQVRHGMFNLWKQEKIRQGRFINDNLLERLPSNDNLQIEVEQKYELERALEVIDQLSPKQRFVIVNNIMNHHKLECIAKALGITIQAVYQLKKRALARLKNNLS